MIAVKFKGKRCLTFQNAYDYSTITEASHRPRRHIMNALLQILISKPSMYDPRDVRFL